jgi:FHS family L-fucose permease-like MFS transporter
MPRNRYMVGLVFLIFFVMSLLTNILGPIVPDIISSFKVSLAAAAFLPFSFFIAYGVMSIPAGFLVERFSEKPVMILAFLAGTVGSLSFALYPAYGVAILSLFVMGAGMATLQVAINPLLRVAGGEEHFAFNSAFAQLIFGSASFLSPRIYSYLVQNLGKPHPEGMLFLRALGRLTPPQLPWASMYWIFAGSTALMVVVLLFVRIPKIKRKADEQAGTLSMYSKLLRNPTVWLFFGCVFAYVGSEQGTADWISQFLANYHGADPHTTGATAVSWFWGLLTAGCFLGMLLSSL